MPLPEHTACVDGFYEIPHLSPSSVAAGTNRVSTTRAVPFLHTAKNDRPTLCMVLTLNIMFVTSMLVLEWQTGSIRLLLVIALAVSYSAYIVENLLSTAFVVILALRNAAHPLDHLSKLKMTAPVISHSVTGWHSARCGPSVLAASAGDLGSPINEGLVSNFPQLFRVNTLFQAEPFTVRRWQDVSDWAVLSLPMSTAALSQPIVFLHLSKTLHYMDYDTELSARKQAERLCEENRKHDQYLDFTEHYSVPGYHADPVLCCGKRMSRFSPKQPQVSEMSTGVNATLQREGVWVTTELQRTRASAASLERSASDGKRQESPTGRVDSRAEPFVSRSGCETAAASEVELGALPFTLSPYFFVLLTLFMLSWPFRIYLQRSTSNIHFVLRKVVSVGEGAPSLKDQEGNVFT